MVSWYVKSSHLNLSQSNFRAQLLPSSSLGATASSSVLETLQEGAQNGVFQRKHIGAGGNVMLTRGLVRGSSSHTESGS